MFETLSRFCFFFFSSRRRHTRLTCDWSSDVCSSDLPEYLGAGATVTNVTPAAGSLSTAGQAAHARPVHGDAGALALTGKAASVLRTTVVRPSAGSLALTGVAPVVANRPNLVAAVYTGNGSSPRTFTVYEFTPAFVLVVGNDGSGNTVGAIKSAAMPANKSQPLASNEAAADATRSNRILSIVANGFTVGSDLNASGRTYFFIAFPQEFVDSIATGSYTGTGGTNKGHNNTALVVSGSTFSNIPTTVGDADTTKWNRPSGSTVYTASTPLIKGGRRVIRLSDGAVIGEAVTRLSSTSFTGIAYITGTFGIGTWDWEEQYVETGVLADAAWWTADDTVNLDGGGVPIPTQFAPGLLADGTEQDFNATGQAPPQAFFPSGDTRVHVNDGGTSGVVYEWFAFRDRESREGLRVGMRQWTGTGATGTPPTLNDFDFNPAFVMVFRTSDTLRFAEDIGLLPAGKTRVLWDGQTDLSTDDPTFVTGGITIPALSNWNLNGAVYRGIFLGVEVPTLRTGVQTAALTLSGQAVTVRRTGVSFIKPNTAETHLTGKQPTLTPNVTRLTPNTAAGLILTPRNPLRAQKRLRQPLTGKLALTGK